MSDTDRGALRILLGGRVQGVGMRAWLVAQATALGLDGWVRNRTDGTVEACAYGPERQLAELLRHCHEGSRAASVKTVEATREPWPAEPPAGFTQRPTV